MPKLDTMKKGYAALWDECDITDAALINGAADRILVNKPRYQSIENETGVPWILTAVLHMRESSLSYNAHLHNGDPLTGKTYHVPAGRPPWPPKNGSRYTFEESADDALVMKGLDKITDWSIERLLFETENFNGWGYLDKGNSPYVWAGTDLYNGGKYVRDGVYDPNAWDKQPGCAGMFKALAVKDADARKWVSIRATGAIPADAKKKATKRERTGVLVGGATTIGGGAGTTTATTQVPTMVEPKTKIIGTFGGTLLLVVGLGIISVAAVKYWGKAKSLAERWGDPAPAPNGPATATV